MNGGSLEKSQLQLIAQDVPLLQSFQSLKYTNVALLTLLLYDYCLTFNLEKTRIWTLRWGLPKILFMINRYFLPPFFFFEGISNVVYVGQTICNVRVFTLIPVFPAIMTVELMLMLRVLALHNNSKFMARFLIILFFAQMVGLSILAVFILQKARNIAGQKVFSGCLSDLPECAYLAWLQPLVVESILVLLCVCKCRMYGTFSPTTKVLARDSVVYFVSITAILTFNICYVRHYPLLGSTLTLPTSILASIAGARLSMNIRSIAMGRALETLAEQSCIIPSMLFRGSHGSVSAGDELFRVVTGTTMEEIEGLPHDHDSDSNDDELWSNTS